MIFFKAVIRSYVHKYVRTNSVGRHPGQMNKGQEHLYMGPVVEAEIRTDMGDIFFSQRKTAIGKICTF